MSDGADEVVLRRWTTTDADVDAVLAAFTDPGVARQAWEPVTTTDEARQWIERRIEQDGVRDESFAISVAGVAVGGVRLSSIDRTSQLTGWIGYWLAFEARGRGLASRATASLAQWAFDELGLERIVLSHRVNNPESGAVAGRSGFTQEGIQREALRHDGVRYDVASWARLHTDTAPVLEPLRIT